MSDSTKVVAYIIKLGVKRKSFLFNFFYQKYKVWESETVTTLKLRSVETNNFTSSFKITKAAATSLKFFCFEERIVLAHHLITKSS